jgi:uncharacterized protein (TIGR02270 family)
MHALASNAAADNAAPLPQPAFHRPPIVAVVQQHADDAAHLRHVRSVLVRAPHVKLLQLKRLDDRIEAHLDGLAVAGPFGQSLAEAALARLGCGEVFAATVCALQAKDDAALQRLFALAPASPEAHRGVVSALGWVTPSLLRDVVRRLLAAEPAWLRMLGIEACRLHRVDAGPVLVAALSHEDESLRRAALRCAAELGRADLLPRVLSLLDDAQLGACAAHASVLLGDRGAGLRALELAAFDAPTGRDALRSLAVQALLWDRARDNVRTLSQHADPRPLLRAVGWLGDARLVPWLVERMAEPQLARLAGEAFSAITGADLAMLDLERKPPADFVSGPTDDPDDDNVALDEDESLPWPDPERVQRWWQTNAARFPPGVRCFAGGAVDESQCLQVLSTSTQRMRSLAAQQLVLLRPGHPLFAVAAPAWRQQRALAPASA